MKTKKVILIAIAVLVSLTAGWILLKPRGVESSISHSAEVKQKPSKYICPMHPQITSDKPGTCPICGMNLVLTEETEELLGHDHGESHEQAAGQTPLHQMQGASEGSAVKTETPRDHVKFKLSELKQQMIGIKLGKVEKKALFKAIRAPGRIAFDPELYTAQSEFLEALRQWEKIKASPLLDVRENTQQMIQSSRIRLRTLGLSNDQISRLSQKGSQSEGLLVTGKGQDSWIYADIFEVDLPYIQRGLSAQITANFLQGKTLAGKVVSVDQVIDPNTRTAKVRIQLLENHPSIRPESYVNVTVFAPVGEQISVPLEAIMDTGRAAYVFVKKGEDDFEPRNVNILLETDSEAALGSGVSAGEVIVIGGNFMLDSESRLKSVLQGAGKTSSGHNH